MNIHHGPDGKFATADSAASAAIARGDHLAAQPKNPDLRRHEGNLIPRSTPVGTHADSDSVGVSAPTVRLDNTNSPGVKGKLGSAKQDRITQMRATDQRHFGIEGDVRSRVSKMTPKQLRGPSAKGWPYNN